MLLLSEVGGLISGKDVFVRKKEGRKEGWKDGRECYVREPGLTLPQLSLVCCFQMLFEVSKCMFE